MDKKNTVIGIILLVAAFGAMFWQGQQYSDVEPEAKNLQAVEPKHEQTRSLAQPSSVQAPAASGGIFEAVSSAEIQPTETSIAQGQEFTLENDQISVTFTTTGGAIAHVAFKDYPKELDSEEPYIFNDESLTPALGLGFKSNSGEILAYNPQYQMVKQTATTILFSTQTAEGVKIFRGYSLNPSSSDKEPYLITHETRFVNQAPEAFNLKNLLVNVGSYPSTKGDSFGEYLNAGYYNGDDAEFIKSGDFTASKGVLGFGQRQGRDRIEERAPNVDWAAVKNQFFASVLTPSESGRGIIAEPVRYSGEDELGIQASLEMELGQIPAGTERLMSLEYYVGPKEYKRLQALGKSQDEIMQFGFFGFVSKILLILMGWVHSIIPNWGITIIAVTVIIKLLMWPLTAVQVRSSKRMAKIQEPLKALREKYKTNPQKLQMETMKLFKENGVNPAGGCLPLLVQLPIFLGLYFMLRTASELRFANFLWISDLSVPDTVAHIAGYPLNILPLLMATSMFVQMRSMPSPMTDNMQKKIFQFMPFVFLIFCYNFPAGLVLYWTIQNLLTLVQQYITNRSEDPLDKMKALKAQKEAEAKGKKGRKSKR